MATLQFENDEGSSLGPGISSDEENDFKEARASAAAAAVGNGTASIESGAAGSDDIDSLDAQCVDRYGFVGGKQFTDQDYELPIEVIRKREMKWLDMIDDWEKWMTKKPKKVRERCRKGIPSSLRGRAWQFLCGSKKLVEQNKGRFQELDQMPGECKWLDVIEKDLDRQFPFHEMFAKRDGHGQQDLFRILKAYSIYNPRDGYCQGQAPVAAVLLMHMPAEEAFWCMVQICERYLTGYYSPGLEAVQVDGEVLFGLIKKTLPSTHKHMKKHRIEPILYMTEWFMCIFARTLPWTSVLRVWDMFFCEGVKILFRVALVLLKHTLGHSQQLADSPGLYETMEKLKHIPAAIMQEDFLASEMLKLRIFEKDLEAEHSLSLARRKAIRERQMSSENASAMARDIAAKKKKSNRGKNLAKEWEKEKRKKEKEKGHQADTDSMISMPNSVDLVEDEEAEIEAMAEAEAADAEPEVDPETTDVGTMNNGVQEVVELPDEKHDKKKKKKDKKKKKKEKLELNMPVVNAWQSNDELQSPDYEREYEIVDRFSSTSASPTKSAKSVSRGASDKDMSSEDAKESNGSKKKKKDKKKKSKSKDKEKGSGAVEETLDDVSSVVTTPEGGIEVGDVKEKKKDKKEKKEKKRKKSKESKESKEHVENEVDAIGTAWTEVSHPPSPERQLSDDAASVKSLSKKDKKKEKKEKKEKKKKDKDKDKDKEVETEKGNGVIRNEYASDENLSPVSPIDFEVVERYKPPSENSRKGSEKRMGLIYSDEQWNGIGSIGPLAEIPSFEEMRQMKKVKEEKKKKDVEQRTGPRSAPTSPTGETKEPWSDHAGGVPHSYSNGMESGNASPLSNGSSDSSRKEMAKKMKKRDYHSFDYGTAV